MSSFFISCYVSSLNLLATALRVDTMQPVSRKLGFAIPAKAGDSTCRQKPRSWSIEARDASVPFSAKRIRAEWCAPFESCFERDQYQYQFAVGVHLQLFAACFCCFLSMTVWTLTRAVHVVLFLPLPH